jgi:hypothetical protein
MPENRTEKRELRRRLGHTDAEIDAQLQQEDAEAERRRMRLIVRGAFREELWRLLPPALLAALLLW